MQKVRGRRNWKLETGNWKEADSLYDTAKSLISNHAKSVASFKFTTHNAWLAPPTAWYPTYLAAGLFILLSTSVHTLAGNLEPPAGPNDPASAMYSIEAIYQRLSTGTNVARRTGAFTGPTGPPGSTMHNLNDVMAKAPSNDNINGVTTEKVPTGQTFWGLTTNEWGTQTGTGTRTLSDETIVVTAGYYEATTLTNVDIDLVSTNIRSSVTIFGVDGDPNVVNISDITRTLSPDTTNVEAGYYAATNLNEVDPDLTSTNIRVDTGIFGVTGTVYECSAPKTGQTTSFREGDAGWYSTNYGVAWPSPRFTTNIPPGGIVGGEEVILDNFTGLMWTKNANILGITTNWYAAIDFCNTLDYGGYDDWRLPNKMEWSSLLDFGYSFPPITKPYPFTSVNIQSYWQSTTAGHSAWTNEAWQMRMSEGNTSKYNKTTSAYAWPVRGGVYRGP